MSKRNKPKGKKINPTYWVFCEGKTEAAYTSFLRMKYRLPIEIVTKVAGSSISGNFIRKYKEGKSVHPKDKNYLMYDGDVPELIEKLRSIKNSTSLISTPSIELWFLLHYKKQATPISAEDCIKELENRNRCPYKKGNIDSKLKEKLNSNQKQATERAKAHAFPNNPSSNLYCLIEELEAQIKNV